MKYAKIIAGNGAAAERIENAISEVKAPASGVRISFVETNNVPRAISYS